jgi:TRAP-type C4-dicarboxylate transport system permease small subunit
MNGLQALHKALCLINSTLLAIGRQLAWVCVALMTIIILLQVFYRYWLDNALPWPEEAARALMIWMVAFAAPTAYRYSGFVSIDMLKDRLPFIFRTILVFLLLLCATAVLYKLLNLAIDFFYRGFRSSTSTLRLPWDATQKLKRAWIYLAMPVCFGGMLLINIEMLIREFGQAFGKAENFPEPAVPSVMQTQEEQ